MKAENLPPLGILRERMIIRPPVRRSCGVSLAFRLNVSVLN